MTPEELAERIEEMSPPDRLRLAAELLEERSPFLALSLVRKVELELSTALLLGGRR